MVGQSQKLTQVVNTWENRLRLQKTVRWLPRILSLGLFLSVILVILGKYVWGWDRNFILTTALIATACLFAIMLLWVWLRARSVEKSSQQFDLLFGLRERISTAIEISNGNIQTHPTIEQFQLHDAITTAQNVDHKFLLPLQTRLRDWILILPLLALFLVLLILPGFGRTTTASARSSAENSAIQQAQDDVKDITEDLATDTSLEDATRENLLESLETSLEKLQEEDLSSEEAFAEMNDVEAQLREEADRISDQLQTEQDAILEASSALQEFQTNIPSESNAGDIPTIMEMLQNAEEALNIPMSEQEQSEMAEALENASNATENADQDLADSLQDASDALSEGDQEAANEALEEAQQQAGELQSEQEEQQETVDDLNKAADQAEESADDIADSQQEEQEQQSGQGEQEPEPDEPQIEQQAPGSAPGQEAPGESEGQQSPSDQEGQSSNNEGEPQSGAEAQESSSQSQTSSSQSGTGESTVPQQSEDQSDGNLVTDNDADGTGERAYEAIYAPQRVGGQGGEEIILEPDTSDVPVIEGEFTENPEGESSIPYNQVFGDYADTANRALDSDYIPLGLRDVVKDYFSSLQPE